MTDANEPPPVTPAQSRAARGLLEWSQAALAEAATVGLSTVKSFEKGDRTPTRNNQTAIRNAFEKAGIEFIDENGGGAGVRLAKRGKRK